MELSGLIEKLKLAHLEVQLDSVCEQAAKRELDYKAFLTEALKVEWQGRHLHGVESRLKLARLPWVKTLEQFDFAFQPSLDRKVVRELAGLAFVERAANVIVLGPPGVGNNDALLCAAFDESTKSSPTETIPYFRQLYLERPLAGGIQPCVGNGWKRPILLKNSETRRCQNSLEFFREVDAQSKAALYASESRLSGFSGIPRYPLVSTIRNGA